jgi:integrating conjugative element protein (TIGR03757 family)
MRVIEFDAPARIVASELAALLPSDPVQAAAIARERLEAGGMKLQRRLQLAYQDVVEAWSLGVTKIPAVIVDRRYVVYGETDVDHAVSLINHYGSTQP